MEIMTPTRTKRNSKAPNRFSSDNSRIETSNGTGVTILDYTDNTTSTTNNIVPMSRTIKLKPPTREPLKVKLPKLKRLHSQSTKDITNKSKNDQVKIHKIKLPSLSSKKSKNIGNESGSKGKTKGGSKEDLQSMQMPHQSGVLNSPTTTANSSKRPSTNIAMTGQTTASRASNSDLTISTKLDVSTTSKSSSSNGDKSSSANSSFDLDEMDSGSSRMEIVVSQSDPSNGSGIHCPCGVNDDLGVMVECESCSTWQHGHCINVGTEEEAYEGYICAFCALPQDKARESLRELTVGDRFQSRFKLLESLREQNDTNNVGQQYGCNDTAENNAQLNIEELSQAVNDLQRVMSSLKVKWHLLTSSAYEMELRIWRNPYWSDEKSDSNSDKNNFYFMDICKNNLKLNIRNMVTKLEERCRLIDYAIFLINSNNEGELGSEDSRIKRVKQTLDIVNNGVKDFKNKLKTLIN